MHARKHERTWVGSGEKRRKGILGKVVETKIMITSENPSRAEKNKREFA